MCKQTKKEMDTNFFVNMYSHQKYTIHYLSHLDMPCPSSYFWYSGSWYPSAFSLLLQFAARLDMAAHRCPTWSWSWSSVFRVNHDFSKVAMKIVELSSMYFDNLQVWQQISLENVWTPSPKVISVITRRLGFEVLKDPISFLYSTFSGLEHTVAFEESEALHLCPYLF